MNKTIYSFILIFAILFLSACEDKLNFNPQQNLISDAYITSSEQVDHLLYGAYLQAVESSENFDLVANSIIVSELLANDGDIKWNGTFFNPGEIERKQISPSNTLVADLWVHFYKIINHANIVLENLMLYEDEFARERAEGQAKFLRAYAYFDLVRFFSKPIDNGVNNEELGVPIVTTGTLDFESSQRLNSLKRSTIIQVYNLIIEDLERGIAILPKISSELAYNSAARGLLARVMLQMGNFERARDLANEVIAIAPSEGYELTNFVRNNFESNTNYLEDIFAWQSSVSVLTDLWATQNEGGRSGNPDISIEQQYFDKFDPDDDRIVALIYNDADSNSGQATKKWRSGGIIPFIRLTEMYLIRAEANFELNTSVGASPYTDINELAFRANLPDLDFPLTISELRSQRFKELSFEGHTLHDRKRWRMNIGDLPYDDPKLILPIPQREININRGLKQNDGY